MRRACLPPFCRPLLTLAGPCSDLVKPCPTSIMRRGSIGKLMAKHLEGEGPKPKVTAVACGLYTSYCIIGASAAVRVAVAALAHTQAADGRVHAWGRNDRGQCGLGHTTPVDAPSLVPYLRWAHTVWAGGSHVLALNDKVSSGGSSGRCAR